MTVMAADVRSADSDPDPDPDASPEAVPRAAPAVVPEAVPRATPDAHVAATSTSVLEVQIVAAVEQRSADGDRLRIAVGVNDTVIRHLFSIGLDLHTTRAQASTSVQLRLDGTISELDAAIRELRCLIFDLEHRP